MRPGELPDPHDPVRLVSRIIDLRAWGLRLYRERGLVSVTMSKSAAILKMRARRRIT